MPDAPDTFSLFEEIVKAGIMLYFKYCVEYDLDFDSRITAFMAIAKDQEV